MRSAAYALSGAPLLPAEESLVSAHRSVLDETAALSAIERRLLQEGIGAGGALTRGDFARYASTLREVLARKLTTLHALERAADEYTRNYGRAVGLTDPLGEDTTALVGSVQGIGRTPVGKALVGGRPSPTRGGEATSPGMSFRV